MERPVFLDRERELTLLEERFASDEAELFVLYGRRRVGKTELLTRFCQGKRHIFFVADLDAEPVLRAGLSRAVNSSLLGPATEGAVYESWEQLFRVVAEHARDEALVLVLDEFTYLVSAHPPLASILQRLWDAELRHGRLKLILCGSYIGMMEETVLGYRAPLYGRRTAQLRLEPLEFHDALGFFEGYSPSDRVRAYGVFGGTPAYLRIIAGQQDLLASIEGQVLTRGTFLFDEVRLLLQQELREPRNYFAILEAIASGRTRINGIKQATGIEGLSSYLGTLQDIDLVERVVPVTETQPHKSRRGLYRLKDPFFRFWFRFVHPNRTSLERGAVGEVLRERIAPQMDEFTGPVFERICEQFLWRAGLRGDLALRPQRIGGWWRAAEEIDLIALDEESALVVECKWSKNPVGVDILRALEAKAARVKGLRGRRLWFGLCARSGFTAQVQDIAAGRDDLRLFDLGQITG